MSEPTPQQLEAVKALQAIASGQSHVISASDVLQGLTHDYDLEMISSLPNPELVIQAKWCEHVIRKIGYVADADVIKLMIEDYMKCHSASKGKNNRAKNILDAIKSVFFGEHEIQKSGSMFKK